MKIFFFEILSHACHFTKIQVMQNYIDITDVVPYSIALTLLGDRYEIIFQERTPLPCETTKIFAAAHSHPSSINFNVITVTNPQSQKSSDQRPIGRYEITNFPNNGNYRMRVTFRVDESNMLNVSANTQGDEVEHSLDVIFHQSEQTDRINNRYSN